MANYQSIEPLTECPIHMGLLERPKMLPCQHTFCEECLEKCQRSGGNLLCPTCRKDCGRIDVSALPNDFTKMALLEAVDVVVSSVDASKSKIKELRYEKGLSRAVFTIKCKDHSGKEMFSKVEMTLRVNKPGGGVVQCEKKGGCHEYDFRPTSSGTYVIHASVNGAALSNSPKELAILPPLQQPCSRFGQVRYKGAHDIAVFNDEIFTTYKDNHCVVVTDRHGEHLRSFEINETNMEPFDPFGITVSETGKLYITDMNNHEVFVCDVHGRLKRRIGKEVLKKPNGVALTKNNEVIVVDYDLCCLFMFGLDGKYKRKFGGPGKEYGEFSHPWFIAINSKGHWIVSDSDNRRFQIFDSRPNFRLIKSVPVGYLVRGVVVDAEDKIFITVVIDSGWTKRHHKHAVMMYYPNGKCYGEISLRDDLLRPRGMCITEDSRGEEILIVTDDSIALHKYEMI